MEVQQVLINYQDLMQQDSEEQEINLIQSSLQPKDNKPVWIIEQIEQQGDKLFMLLEKILQINLAG
ncbi:hypothetical protein D3C73_1582530 [compost metagenome]